jgi:hypothetical protein
MAKLHADFKADLSGTGGWPDPPTVESSAHSSIRFEGDPPFDHGYENYKFGWLQGSRKLLAEKNFWLRG